MMLSRVATVALLLTGSAYGCSDSEGWKDEKGYKCGDWALFDCFKAHSFHKYSMTNQEAILRNCPKTCDSCKYFDGKCQDSMTFQDEKGHTCGEWLGHNCYDAVTKWFYSPEGEHAVRKNCPHSCKNCNYDQCSDRHDFTDQKGYRCGDWVDYKCKEAKSEHGYSDYGMMEILKNCPHSCDTCNEQIAPAPKCTDLKLKSGAAWYDKNGPEFDCAWYGQEKKRCRRYQRKTKNEYKAKRACCSCGGGKRID